MKLRHVSLCAVLGSALVACGRGGTGDGTGLEPAGPGQQPSTVPGGNGSPSTPSSCSFTQSIGAAAVVKDTRTPTAPSLSGGALADGLYVLTRYEWVDPEADNTLHNRRIVLEIGVGGTAGQYLWQRNAEAEERYILKITTSGERIALQGTCPSGRTLEWDQYQASGDTLVLFSSSDQKVATFTRR